MEIAVLGGGNGAYAAAADLSEQGHKIRLWRRDAQALAALESCSRLSLKDYHGQREIELSRVTTDMATAVKGAELIVIPTPAFAQADNFSIANNLF